MARVASDNSVAWRYDAPQSNLLGVLKTDSGEVVAVATIRNGIAFLDATRGTLIVRVPAPEISGGVAADFDGDGRGECVVLPYNAPMEVRDARGNVRLGNELGFQHSNPIAGRCSGSPPLLFVSTENQVLELEPDLRKKKSWTLPGAANLTVIAGEKVPSKNGDYFAFLLGGRGGWHRTAFYIFDPRGDLVFHEVLSDDYGSICGASNSSEKELSLLLGGRDAVWRYFFPLPQSGPPN